MFIAVEAAMTNAILLLRNFESAQENDIITSYNREREINNLRNTLRTANIEAINDHRDQYQAINPFQALPALLSRERMPAD